jgi:hypothetical protein
MAGFAKIGKEVAKELLNNSQKIIKNYESGKAKDLTPRNNLLNEPTVGTVEIKNQAGDAVKPKLDVKQGKTTETTIAKKDVKVKKPEVDAKAADEVLEERKFYLNENKIGIDVLSDFNINKINNDQDIAQLIESISKKFAKQINKQKRGVQSQEVLKKLATDLGKRPEDLTAALLQLRPGQTLNAETILAARELLNAGMARLDDLARLASSPQGGDAAVLEFRQHFALMSQLQKKIKGVQTETARALNQFKIQPRQKNYTNVNLDNLNNETLLVELGGLEQNKNLAKLYLKETVNTTQALKFVEEAGVIKNISKASDSIAEIFLNTILSNPITHIKNTAGNWLTQAIVSTERKIAARVFGDGVDGVAELEDIAKAFGKQQSAIEMHAAISSALRSKKVPELKSYVGGSKIETRTNSFSAENFGLQQGKAASMFDVAGRILTLDRIPTKMLSAADNYFKNLEYRSELYALAYRDTVKNYKLGKFKTMDDASAYLADMVVNPDQAMVKQAYDAAHYVTFQTKLNTKSDIVSQVGSTVQNLKNKSGWFSWLSNYYLPFVQTPTNIATFTMERTPGLNLLLKSFYDDMAAGGARAQLAKSKLMLGSSVMLLGAPFGALGYVAGSDPDLSLKGKGELQKTLGQKNRTLRLPIGDKIYQINYGGIDPVAQMIAQSADLGKLGVMASRNPTDWKSYTNLVFAMTVAFGENLSNSTYLQGFGKFAEDIQLAKYAIENNKMGESALQWGKKFGASFVPSGGKQIGSFFQDDNYQKISLEFDELLKRNIAEANLQFDFDIRGRKIQKYGFITTIEQDDVDKELARVSPNITPIKRNYDVSIGPTGLKKTIPVTMQSKELAMLKSVAGQIADVRLKNLINNPTYKNAPEEFKKQLIQKEVSASREKARQTLGQDKEFRNRLETEAVEIYKNQILETEQLKGQGITTNDNININN